MMNFRAPVQPLAPEQLAQLGLAAFKPPQPMNMPNMSGGPQMGGGGDGGLGAGLAGAGMGLGMLGKMGGMGGISEQGAVGPGGLAGAISGIDALKPDANGVWAQPKMPTDIGYGQGGMGGGFWPWVKGLF